MEFNSDPTAIYDCREDDFAINFFKQVITEFVLKIVVEIAVAFAMKTFSTLRKKTHEKDEYELSEQIVWLLYF